MGVKSNNDDKKMVNKEGRTKKYENLEETNVSFSIPHHFKAKYKLFKKIVQSNLENESFRKYCEQQEGYSVDKKLSPTGKGVRSMYLRWMVAQEVFKNKHLLMGKINNG